MIFMSARPPRPLLTLATRNFNQVALILDREMIPPGPDGTTVLEQKLKITMVKGDANRSIFIDPAEETLLVEFLRSAIATSFGFLQAPKAFW
jgi:hypothetical protein